MNRRGTRACGICPLASTERLSETRKRNGVYQCQHLATFLESPQSVS